MTRQDERIIHPTCGELTQSNPRYEYACSDKCHDSKAVCRICAVSFSVERDANGRWIAKSTEKAKAVPRPSLGGTSH